MISLADRARALHRRLFRRSRAYAETFMSSGGLDVAQGSPRVVLAHLHWFCHGGRSSLKVAPDGHVDALASAAAEGRREVWLEIRKMLTLDSAAVELAIDNMLREQEAEE